MAGKAVDPISRTTPQRTKTFMRDEKKSMTSLQSRCCPRGEAVLTPGSTTMKEESTAVPKTREATEGRDHAKADDRFVDEQGGVRP